MRHQGLSAEQQQNLRSALERDRRLTLIKLIGEIAQHNLRPEVDARHKLRMQYSRNRFRHLLKVLRITRKVNDLGKAMSNTRRFPTDVIIDRVDSFVAYDFLDVEAVDRACTSEPLPTPPTPRPEP